MGEWELHQCASTGMARSPAVATFASDEWKSTMGSCVQSLARLVNRYARALYKVSIEWISTGYQDTMTSPRMKKQVAKGT